MNNNLLNEIENLIKQLIEERNCDYYNSYNHTSIINTSFIINKLISIYNIYSNDKYLYIYSDLKKGETNAKIQ